MVSGGRGGPLLSSPSEGRSASNEKRYSEAQVTQGVNALFQIRMRITKRCGQRIDLERRRAESETLPTLGPDWYVRDQE